MMTALNEGGGDDDEDAKRLFIYEDKIKETMREISEL